MNRMTTRIETTADGSHTLYVPELHEHYHSTNGAVQESQHVFIDAGLRHCDKKEIHVFEVGFGTGLNALLTLADIIGSDKTVFYTAIEAYPLPAGIVSQLNYSTQHFPYLAKEFDLLHQSVWNSRQQIAENFFLTKIEGDLTSFDFSSLGDSMDVIYYDAFAPDKQTDMWTQSLFDEMYSILHRGGILTTYCAKGVVRRMIQHSGFTTERLPGPPGKREMLRAVKI